MHAWSRRYRVTSSAAHLVLQKVHFFCSYFVSSPSLSSPSVLNIYIYTNRHRAQLFETLVKQALFFTLAYDISFSNKSKSRHREDFLEFWLAGWFFPLFMQVLAGLSTENRSVCSSRSCVWQKKFFKSQPVATANNCRHVWSYGRKSRCHIKSLRRNKESTGGGLLGRGTCAQRRRKTGGRKEPGLTLSWSLENRTRVTTTLVTVTIWINAWERLTF